MDNREELITFGERFLKMTKDSERDIVDEFIEEALKLFKQESALDKIKKEIEALPKTYPFVNHFDMYVKVSDVTKIIDKYSTDGWKDCKYQCDRSGVEQMWKMKVNKVSEPTLHADTYSIACAVNNNAVLLDNALNRIEELEKRLAEKESSGKTLENEESIQSKVMTREEIDDVVEKVREHCMNSQCNGNCNAQTKYGCVFMSSYPNEWYTTKEIENDNE